jgi:23S rRNA (adenine-N6)-dimethyltransferase
MAGRRARPASSTRGRHALRSRPLADELVREAGIAPGDLVLDLGAGVGALTAALRAAGARVVAVELDPVLAGKLRARFPEARVISGDAARVALPGEPFVVVANLPFASGTAILRHLLDDPRVPLTRLDAIVEWGLAAKRTRVWPSTLLGVYWSAWYELTLARRVSRSAFMPPPAVEAAVLRAVRRPEPLVAPAEAGAYLRMLRIGFGDVTPLRRRFPRQLVRRLAHEHGFSPDATARDLDARQWASVYRAQTVKLRSRIRS